MDDEIKNLATYLLNQESQKQINKRNDKIKKVLLLLAQGSALTISLVLPNAIKIFEPIFDDKSSLEWKKFNKSYLKRTLKNLESQKIIEIEEKGNHSIVKITDKGKKKIYSFGLSEISIPEQANWDHQWRIVFYDVYENRKPIRDRLQKYLKSAGFYQMQDSVYLHAYPCEDIVEFIRSYLGIAGEVRMVLANKIENDTAYRTYFGIPI